MSAVTGGGNHIELARNWWWAIAGWFALPILGGYMVVTVTMPALRRLAQGETALVSWETLVILGLDAVIVAILWWLSWTPLTQMRTVFTDDGITQWGIFGRKQIRWRDVRVIRPGFTVETERMRMNIHSRMVTNPGELEALIAERAPKQAEWKPAAVWYLRM
jgi:hypothetical protein